MKERAGKTCHLITKNESICPKCKTSFWPTFTVLEFVGQRDKPRSPSWKGWRLENKNKM